jgi:hypothetical protein
MTYYIHDVPGRLRVKIPLLKANPSKADEIQRLLQGVGGVRNTSFNPLTGSLIVVYDPESVASEKILALLKEEYQLQNAKALTADEFIQSAASKVGETISRAALSWAMGQVFEASGLSFLSVLV